MLSFTQASPVIIALASEHAHYREPRKTTTFVAALRHDWIDAPWVLDGPIDGENFRTCVERILVPTLKPGPPEVAEGVGAASVSGLVMRVFNFEQTQT